MNVQITQRLILASQSTDLWLCFPHININRKDNSNKFTGIYSDHDYQRMWRGIQAIINYKSHPPPLLDTPAYRSYKFNTFFGWLEDLKQATTVL